MKLSQPQVSRFWREWAQACRAAGWTKENGYGKTEQEEERKKLLARAGFSSLTQVTRVGGFDRVLGELAALTRPGDLNAQIHLAGNAPRVLRHAILHHPTGDAWRAIAADRWRAKMGENPTDSDLENLSEGELRQLRDTLADRLAAHRPETLARRAFNRAEKRAISAPADDPNPF